LLPETASSSPCSFWVPVALGFWLCFLSVVWPGAEAALQASPSAEKACIRARAHVQKPGWLIPSLRVAFPMSGLAPGFQPIHERRYHILMFHLDLLLLPSCEWSLLNRPDKQLVCYY
jgi:hypothetical protein